MTLAGSAVWARKKRLGRNEAPIAKITNPAGGQWSLSRDAQRMANWRKSVAAAEAARVNTNPLFPTVHGSHKEIRKAVLTGLSPEENGHA